MMARPLVIGIVGPTASGKSRLAVEVAKRLAGEIVSVDSMQVYRHMDIGTAKTTPEEMQGIPHHLLDLIEPSEIFNAQRYLTLANNAIDDILARNKTPIIAGGTGLYYDSLVSGINLPQHDDDRTLRRELEAYLSANGKTALFDRMISLDPAAGEKVHPNNTVRVIRTIELLTKTGKTLHQIEKISKSAEKKYSVLTFGIEISDRQLLYKKIDDRVDVMFARGLVQEVTQLIKLSPSITAMNAIGYKEVGEYLENKITLEQAVEKVKINTHHYAKRQMTWFRRNSDTIWLDAMSMDCAQMARGIVEEYTSRR